jgi:hypothetical protein
MAKRSIVALGAALAAMLVFAAAAFGLPPFSTDPQSAGPRDGGQSELSGASVGCHKRFDRFVVRVGAVTPAAYRARYVNKIVADGTGATVRLLGTKRLRVLFPTARAHRESDGAPLVARTLTPKCPNLRQVKLAGDFEGVVTFGFGLRAKNGFRAFRLTSPDRVVVDVKH